MNFWVKTKFFIKILFPNYIWEIPNTQKKVYLTFDDGPTPEVTEWTLDVLKKHHAKATFFCIGHNIEKHPALFEKIIKDGHSIGNHTFNHLKGWNTSLDQYIENTKRCEEIINKEHSTTYHLFRPPYGKIKPSQSKRLRKLGYKIIMWDVLSRDFDQSITPKQCLENVLKNIRPGSIIVFHDSIKAQENLRHALPKTLEFLNNNGFVCSAIE